MPWHIENDNAECDGFAVVKDATGEIEGCHRTRQQANDQLAALYAAEPAAAERQLGMEGETESPAEQSLTDRQKALYNGYETVVEQFGMFDKTTTSNGAHYVEQSPFIAEGLMCANCVFYEGGQNCEIVAGDIKPEAICKLWIIPDSLITPTRLAQAKTLLKNLSPDQV